MKGDSAFLAIECLAELDTKDIRATGVEILELLEVDVLVLLIDSQNHEICVEVESIIGNNLKIADVGIGLRLLLDPVGLCGLGFHIEARGLDVIDD